MFNVIKYIKISVTWQINIIIIIYFINLPLFIHKYVCIPVFIDLYRLQVSKEYKNLDTIKKLKELKSKMKIHSILNPNKYIEFHFYQNWFRH